MRTYTYESARIRTNTYVSGQSRNIMGTIFHGCFNLHEVVRICTYLYESRTNVYVSVRICTYMVRMCTYICCLDYGLDHGVHICTHAFAHSGICWIVPFSDLHCILAARPVQLSVAWGHSESESRAVTNNLRFNHALVSGVPHHVWFTLLWFVQ